jgi:hypothetical protein
VKDITGETVIGIRDRKAFLVLGAFFVFDLLLIGAVVWFLRAHGIL